MKQRRRRSKFLETDLFWRDVYLSGGQVTFGVVAALWFIPPFDTSKIIVLLLNSIATAIFVIKGLKISKKYE